MKRLLANVATVGAVSFVSVGARADLVVSGVAFDNALSAGRMVVDTDYNLTAINAGGVDYTLLEGGVSTDATSDTFVFGSHQNNDGGEYDDIPGSVSGLNLGFGLGNIEGGTWQFTQSLTSYDGFAFFELQGQEAVTLSLVDQNGQPVGNYSYTSSNYGSEVALSPGGGWYRPGNGTQFASDTGPVGVFFTLDDFSESTPSGTDLSVATGFRIDGALDAIDPFALVAANIPEPASGVLVLLASLCLLPMRRKR